MLPENEVIDILNSQTNAVLALAGDDGYPYSLPISYVYTDGKIYFHSAVEGHKIDAILREPKVSFSVIQQDEIQPELFTTFFRSVIGFGKARIVEDEAEKMASIVLLGQKYSPGLDAKGKEEIDMKWAYFHMIAIDIEHMTGKESLRLTMAREKK